LDVRFGGPGSCVELDPRVILFNCAGFLQDEASVSGTMFLETSYAFNTGEFGPAQEDDPFDSNCPGGTWYSCKETMLAGNYTLTLSAYMMITSVVNATPMLGGNGIWASLSGDIMPTAQAQFLSRAAVLQTPEPSAMRLVIVALAMAVSRIAGKRLKYARLIA
jgi:hypothetical protein